MVNLIDKIIEKKIILSILILAFLLRLINLNQSFWLDEATSGLVVRNLSYSEIIAKFSPNDFHPPLYYLILKFWSGIFGSSEIALRSFSLILGVVSVYLIYQLGSLLGREVGLVSALFLAVNGLHIYYSQEARMYILSLFLVLFLFYLYIKTIESGKNIYWLMFSLFLVLNFLTDYLPNMVILVLWIYGFLFVRDKKWWLNFFLSHMPLIIFFLVWCPILFKQIGIGLNVKETGSLWWNILGRVDLKSISLVPIKFILGRISLENKNLYFSLITFLSAFYFICFLKGFSKKLLKNKNFILLLYWFFLPFIFSAIIGLFISIFSYFRLIFILPPFLLIITFLILNLPKSWKNIALIFSLTVSIVSALSYLFLPNFHRENWRGLVSEVKKESQNNFALVFASDYQREAYQYYGGPKEIVKKDDFLDKKIKRIWYIRYLQDIFDPKDLVKQNIENSGYKRGNIYDFNGIIVWEYENSD